MADHSFQLLNLPPDASIDEIKKAFRSLIMKHHPDITGRTDSHTSTLIEAYHDAVAAAAIQQKKTKQKEQDEKALFLFAYELFFRERFAQPRKKEDFYGHLSRILGMLKTFFYADREFDFLSGYMQQLAAALSPFRSAPETSWADYLYAVFENVSCLLTFRKNALQGTLHQDEYTLEKLRLTIIRYFETVIAAKNPLDLRLALFATRDSIMRDCISSINATSVQNYRQEIFTLLSLIVLISEEELVNSWPF